MSNQAQNTAPNAADAKTNELLERFKKRGKALVMAGQDDEEFTSLVSGLDEKTVIDWTKKAPWQHPTYALIETRNGKEMTGERRLIAIADPDSVFADSAARAAIYRWYTSKVANEASDPEATEDMFITPSGCFRVKYDNEAFAFQAAAFVSLLREKGLTGISNSNFKFALSTAAFADSRFPKMKDKWAGVLDLMIANATKAGYNTAWLEHAKATRDVVADTSEAFDLTLDELEIDVQAKLAEDAKEAAQPATATA